MQTRISNLLKWIIKALTFSGVSEIVLKHQSGDDAVFHRIEVERL